MALWQSGAPPGGFRELWCQELHVPAPSSAKLRARLRTDPHRQRDGPAPRARALVRAAGAHRRRADLQRPPARRRARWPTALSRRGSRWWLAGQRLLERDAAGSPRRAATRGSAASASTSWPTSPPRTAGSSSAGAKTGLGRRPTDSVQADPVRASDRKLRAGNLRHHVARRSDGHGHRRLRRQRRPARHHRDLRVDQPGLRRGRRRLPGARRGRGPRDRRARPRRRRAVGRPGLRRPAAAAGGLPRVPRPPAARARRPRAPRERQAARRRDPRDHPGRSTTSPGPAGTPARPSARARCTPGCSRPTTPPTWSTSRSASSA